MELTHLQSFLAVYRTRNITRAAEQLHVSQPAVTSHLRSLEAELNRPLFIRLPRGVAPTLLADQLAREIQDPLETLASTIGGFRPDADLSKATPLLGGPVDALSEVVLPSLVQFATQGLSIRVTTGLTSELLNLLSTGELDLVIATTPARHRSVTVQRLFDEELALTLSSRLATILGRSVDLNSLTEHNWPAMLQDAPLIAFAENAPLVRRYWRTIFGLSNPPTPNIVISDLRAIASAVSGSASWTVLPTYLSRERVSSGDLVTPFHPLTPPTNTLYLAKRTIRTSPVIDRVAEHLHTTFS